MWILVLLEELLYLVPGPLSGEGVIADRPQAELLHLGRDGLQLGGGGGLQGQPGLVVLAAPAGVRAEHYTGVAGDQPD